MSHAPTLNAYAPGTWARVVSAVTWAEHTLTPGGTFGAEVTRGPLIVWARKPGEGEDLPHLGQPTPSPLEARAEAVNLRAHFLAFQRAACGKVRHSVRWKTGARRRRLRKWSALDRLRYLAHAARRRELGLTGGFLLGKMPRTAREKRASRKWAEDEKKHVALMHLYPSVDPEEAIDSETLNAVCEFEEAFRQGRVPDWALQAVPVGDEDEQLVKGSGTTYGLLLRHYLVTGRRDTCAALVAWPKRRKAQERLSLALALRFLERAAYRAHLSRRVRPVSRRARLPRPLYARPRPPTAPLAPPLA